MNEESQKTMLRLLLHPQLNGCQYFFCIQWEFAFQDPAIIPGLFLQNFLNSNPLIFPEVDCFNTIFVVNNSSNEIHIEVVRREFAQRLNIVNNGFRNFTGMIFIFFVFVCIQLSFQYFVSRPGVGHGSVRIFQRFLAIKFIGCTQSALFHFMENGLNINKLAFFQVNVNIGAQKLLSEQWNIKPVRIETCKITTFDKLNDSFSHFLKSRFILYILIINTVNLTYKIR